MPAYRGRFPSSKYAAILLVCLFGLCVIPSQGQGDTGTVSGKVTTTPPGGSAQGVAGAKVSVKNVATGQTTETATDATGQYRIAGLPAGDYEVTVTAPGLASQVSRVTLALGGEGPMRTAANFTLTAAGAQPAQALPSAPKPRETEPSLQDLGFPSSETQGNAQMQARLDKRSRMLQIHQRLGLITTIPLIATVISGTFAGGRSTSSTDRDIHAGLGSLTVGLYAATAWYAIRAPKIPETHSRGEVRFHKAMVWIHGPGMILTPILGAMAFEQKSKGEKVHGIAAAHSAVAIITASAYGAGLLSVTLKW